MGLDYNASKSIAFKTILLLGAITIVEVLFCLLGKGYLVEGFHISHVIIGLVMICMSIVKAYFIIFEFMHMKYEIPGMAKTVLIPTLLLVWAVIAFLWEGSDWNHRRTLIQKKNEVSIDAPVGYLDEQMDIKKHL